jgi:hypothetical protein
MKMTKLAGVYLAILALIASSLACNAPTQTSDTRQPSITPSTAPADSDDSDSMIPEPADASEPEAKGTEDDAEEAETGPSSTTEPTPTRETPVPAATDTPRPTETPTATATPTATPTPLLPGETLEITGQGFEIADWQELPESGEWEGHLRVTFSGGLPPYEFAIETGEPETENYLYIRWRKCVAAPLTVHIWSADGQEAHKSIWVVSPWCPD